MTAVIETVDKPAGAPNLAARMDQWFESWGDALNPILVKESRQALKSKQFVVTFSLLLLASFGWSVIGSLVMMPGIYFVPSAPTMLIGYYLVLAVPMLMVVPLAAFRSLAVEIDDGTLELLTVSALTPSQVVTGKLASAMLQLMLYFVALVPCVAYAYALRGTDMPTLLLLLTTTLLMAIQLTVIGIFLAPMTAGRSGQLTMLVAYLVILVAAEFAFGSFAIALITEQLAALTSYTGTVILCSLALVGTSSAVLLTAAAAQLTPPSENRSTSIRVALFIQQTVMVAMVSYVALGVDPESGMGGAPLRADFVSIVPTFGLVALLGWLIVGSLMASESAVLTPRVRRDLPASFAGRMLKTWWMPGPGTGVVFAVGNAAIVGLFVFQFLQWIEDSGWLPRWMANLTVTWSNLFLAAIGYLAVLLVLVRICVAWLRRHTETQPAIGVAVLVVLSAAMSLIPYAIELHLNDYRQFSYSWWQFSNWPWTLRTISTNLASFRYLPWAVFAVGATVFLLHVLLLGRTVLPQRLATPQRVQEEQGRH